MKASIFIPCLVDQFFPETGLAMARVLRHLGVEVDTRRGQTCCGQPAFNAGYRDEASLLATRFLERFDGTEAVVAPSGSCVSMVRNHFEGLPLPPAARRRCRQLKGRVHEFTEFLTGVLHETDLGGRLAARVAYHPSCHARCELGVDEGPRRLLAAVRDLTLVEVGDAEACCGFGGAFAVKFSELSTALAERKCRRLEAAGVDHVVAVDASCLMQIGGLLRRRGIPVQPLPMADLLARSLGLV